MRIRTLRISWNRFYLTLLKGGPIKKFNFKFLGLDFSAKKINYKFLDIFSAHVSDDSNGKSEKNWK